MGCRELVVFVLLCFGLGEARFLKVKMPTRWALEDQKPAEGVADPPAVVAGKLQSRWLPPTEEPHSWNFPGHPVKRLPVPFEPQWPERQSRVGVRCGESRIQVEVSQDLLGIGKLIKPEEITLGGCSAIEVDDLAHVLVFESELHGCGSRLVMTENAFIYAFTLDYNPKASGKSQIIRSQPAVVGVECHYQT